MKKILFFIAAIVALGFAFWSQNSRILSGDIFFVMQQVKEGNKPEEAVKTAGILQRAAVKEKEKQDDQRLKGVYPLLFPGKPALDQAYDFYEDSLDGFGSMVRGAALSANMERVENLTYFFERLAATEEVDTFVILSSGQRGMVEKIAVSEYAFDTVYGQVLPDFELMDELLEQKLVTVVDGAFAEVRAVHAYAAFIKKSFPEARVLAVAINEDAAVDDLKNIAQVLSEEGEKKLFVIAPAVFETINGDSPSYEVLNQFHEEYFRNLLGVLDPGGLEQAVTEYRKPLQTLMEYLLLEKAFVATDLGRADLSEDLNFYFAYSEGVPTGSERRLTMKAFGDMMLGRHVRVLMDINGLDYIFRNIRGENNIVFEGADLIHANLEGPIKGAGKKGGTSMNFAFNEDVAPLLAEHGFNLLSLSNNHAVDQGWEGRETTITALENAGIDWCGHPSEADPESVYYGQVMDKKFAFICLHDVTFDLDEEAAVRLISEVNEKVDFLIVSIHWGVEYQHRPHQTLQVAPAHRFVDAGADLVLGHHPHVVQSFEQYNGKFIFYSLGNFVFDQYWSQATQEELGLAISLGKSKDFEEGEIETTIYLLPMKSKNAQSRLMREAEYQEWIERFIGYGDYSEEMKAMIREGVIRP